MSDLKLKSGCEDDGNISHKVQNTRVGRDIFRVVKDCIENQKKDTGEARLDWGEVFYQIMFEYFDSLQNMAGFEDFLDALSPSEKRELVETFLVQFSAIKMDDTLFEDVKNGEGLERISRVAGEVDIWTAGDTINRHQSAKLMSAEIYRLIHRALSGINLPVRRNDIIADEKASKIPDTLDFFVRSNGASELIVAVFDDKPGALKKADDDINGWTEGNLAVGKKIKVHPLYIRAMRGRHGNEPWPDDYNLQKEEAESLIEVAEKIEAEATAKKIPRENIIVFLDFDGAMSDNRILRLRQTQVMYRHIMKAVKTATVKYLAKKHACTVDNEKDVLAMIKAHRDEVWDIYDMLVRPPHHFLNGILAEIAGQTGRPLDRSTVEALYEVDAYLQSSGWLNPKFSADDMRKEFLGAVKEHVDGDKGYFPSFKYNNKTRFINDEYFKNEKRKGKDGDEERIVKLLMDDNERDRALTLAREFESKLTESRYWKNYILCGHLSFYSGGIKSKTELIKKIAEVLEKKRGDWERVMLFHDLVRGTFVVNNMNRFYSLYKDLDEMVWSFLIGFSKDDIVAFHNFYLEPYNLREDGGPGNPLLGFKIVFRLVEDVHYELQVVTRLAFAVGRLNHDTVFKPTVALRDSQRDYIKKMSWCAHFMDLEKERFVVDYLDMLEFYGEMWPYYAKYVDSRYA